MSGSNLTTGALKTTPFTKTIYDPNIWTDTNLANAAKEALEDFVNNNGTGVIPNLPTSSKFTGRTSQGYQISGFIQNGVVTTFYFGN
jgi:hypothetical protein